MDSHSHDTEHCEHTHSTCDYVSDQKLNEYLVNDDIIYDATQIFDALSDFTRFQILGALVNGEKSVTELQEMLSVSQSATSHQLRLLRDRGLVNAKRDGRKVIYSLADEHVTTLIRVGLAHAAHLLGH